MRRPYEDWITYDQFMLHLYDACLRLNAELDSVGYQQSESTGADAEVQTFLKLGRPVFYSIQALYDWIDEGCPS